MSYTLECPVNDWLCPYFDNGNCALENSKKECDEWFELEDNENGDIQNYLQYYL